ncbi:MAG: hypothetical protein F6K40_08915 [Okeania sp. SIO3I5]|uniref:hypothetical protein n=1 Tax=Okeania sp. SIO3I5 TaxID=2607805 RepID=UPI0013B689B7|nr:hypothetical protein [Okeania sp. SIO3I5]NEQ36386.1 hypothetical protein [Okeania sp. SIO3I5]
MQSEDNKNIPIPDVNQRDIKILASAFNLAIENNNCVVVLITYDEMKKVLINQKQVENLLPNFCAIPAGALAWWYHNGRPKNRLPDEVWDAQQRIRFSQKASPQSISPSTTKSPPKSIGGKNNYRKIEPHKGEYHPVQRTPIKPNDRNQKHLPSGKGNFKEVGYRNTPINKSLDPNIFIFGIVGVLITGILLLLVIGNFSRQKSVPQTQIGNLRANQTPPTLIAEARASIIRFQNSKDSSDLTKPMYTLQELKDKQGGYLDADGEQTLSRLKHKYAIEVLASSGQLVEAAKILRQIPPTYDQYPEVRSWLNQNNL